MKFLGILLAASAVLFGQTYHNQDGKYSFSMSDDWGMVEENKNTVVFQRGTSDLVAMTIDWDSSPMLKESLEATVEAITTGQSTNEEVEMCVKEFLRLSLEDHEEIVTVTADFTKAAQGLLKFSYLMEIEKERVSFEQVVMLTNNRLMVFAIEGESEDAAVNAEALEEIVLSFAEEVEQEQAPLAEATEEVVADTADEDVVAVSSAEEETVANVAEEEEVADVATEEEVADVAEEEVADVAAEEEVADVAAEEEVAKVADLGDEEANVEEEHLPVVSDQDEESE